MEHTTALAIVIWYLIVPSHPQTSATGQSGSAFVFDTYSTRDTCEQEQRRLSDDPDIGDKMRIAKCSEIAPSSNRQ